MTPEEPAKETPEEREAREAAEDEAEMFRPKKH